MNNFKKIILFVPNTNLSGGPELFYQLAESLKSHDLNAFLFFFGDGDSNKSKNRFSKYDVTFIDHCFDDENNLLILPESFTKLTDYYPKSQKCIFWCSIDNYYRYKSFNKLENIIKKIGSLFRKRVPLYKLKKYTHISQSHYAMEYLKKRGIKSYFIGDYISNHFYTQNTLKVIKEDFVLFNPKKGYKFIKKFINFCPEIKFVPIENMTPEEVNNILSKAKIYIDFGRHPGKDRIPREAVLNKCCIITNHMGSAGNDIDLPIPLEYKFRIIDNNSLKKIKNLIEKVFSNYDYEIIKFNNYREIVSREKAEFYKNCEEIFCKKILNKH
tara:strand:- start:363 stop:1343 length:981 start_codon:yes stop_codon:yes gene_type:complete